MPARKSSVLVLSIFIFLSACSRGHLSSTEQSKDVAEGLSAYQSGNLEAAKKAWLPAAASGNPDAQYYLGVLSNEAQPPDFPTALEWFQKASSQGHVEATYNLALAYEQGRGTKPDHAKAEALLRQASARGSAEAEYTLGLLLVNDDGKGNLEEGVEWLTRAAVSGNSKAQYVLGTGYAEGSFGNKDSILARKWLARAIQSGKIEALRPYVDLQAKLDPLSAKSIGELASEATQGNANAQHAYAVRLITGDGVKPDEAAGMDWMEKSAALGNTDAEYDLGIFASTGDTPDYKKAIAWLSKAAAKGHARAEYAIGQLHADGLGFEKDESQAVAWYRKAASRGLPSAEYAMGFSYSEGNGVQRDDPTAMQWFKKAAGHGHAEAAFRISTMYANGEGVSKDAREQRRWECRAALLGSDRSTPRIQRSGGFDQACNGLQADLSDFAISVLGSRGKTVKGK